MIKPIDKETVKKMTMDELWSVVRKNNMSQSDSWGYINHQTSIVMTEIDRRTHTSKGT